MSLETTATQESMSQKLADIQASISKMQKSLRQESEADRSTQIAQEDGEQISKNLQQLIQAADSFHSNASSVLGKRSTIWDGSILGNPLDEDQVRNIQDWIPEAPGPESKAVPQSTVQVTEAIVQKPTSLSPFTTGTAITEPDTEDDSDTENDLFQSLYDRAISNFKAGHYDRAEMFLARVVSRLKSKPDSRIEVATARLMHAHVCTLQGKRQDAENVLKVLAMSAKLEIASCANHILATSCFQRKDFANALRFCKKARTQRRKTMGRESPLFAESMLFLAKIHDADGDLAEAEVCRALVSPIQEHFDCISPFTYLWNAVSCEESLRLFFVDCLPSELEEDKEHSLTQQVREIISRVCAETHIADRGSTHGHCTPHGFLHRGILIWVLD